MRNFKTLFILCIVLYFIIVPVFALTSSEEYIVNAVKKAKPSVVNIDTFGGSAFSESSSPGIGSGVIITKDGYIITNAHVIRNARNIRVTLHDGKKFFASVVRASSDHDIAVIKINPGFNLKAAVWGNSDSLELGQTVIAIGNPMRFTWTVTVGVISALGRNVNARGIKYRDLIQTDAAINPGNSGGALINTEGQVIGINTLVYTGDSRYSHAQGLSFAIPANQAREIAKELIQKKGFARLKPWVGISGVDLTSDMAEQYGYNIKSGLLIVGVMAGSPASRAMPVPLMRGDVISNVDERVIRGVSDFKNIMSEMQPGAKMKIGFWRNNKKLETTLVIEQLSQ